MREGDRDTYAHVGAVLRAGLLSSIGVMAIGLIAAAVRGHASTVALPLQREASELAKGNPNAILDLGILLLFATPLAGVLTAAVELWREGDREFALVSAGVLALVVAGIAVALL